MERILIMTMGFGTGHNVAAKALAQSYGVQADVATLTIDLLELTPKTFHPLLQVGYSQMLSRFPAFYYYLYNRTFHNRFVRYISSEFIEKIGWMIRKKLKRILADFQPTQIVSTHPFGFLMLPSRWRYVPTAGVVTDYEVHGMWLAQAPDLLCIPHQLLSEKERRRLAWQTGSRIIETGIPSEAGFHQKMPSKEARLEVGLPVDHPFVLVMCGGLGCGPLPHLVEELARLDSPTEVWVLTGKNDKLYEDLSTRYEGTRVRIFQYRRDVSRLMDAADLLITKPGGLTVTEAMAKGLPMLLFEAFPGQETTNLNYLLREKVAIAVNEETIWQQTATLLANHEQRMRMSEGLMKLSKPEAASRVVAETLRLRTLDSAL
ncbi:processive 1,2-diacylglycerol beta-glucosyltransferase [Marininema mesophilum]|uniref:Processive 1,2-diacylglycerol beta-glucosyltransferase n=1 Tax=Marininema mesophilum TaxID=1048340 RepID=A0A1H3BKV9_9BACL|nr:glycosyltransferase [Marininema mesophilum]SDX42593.1 processive 1,2-diacylglycerol beta-glucosyltransferase [Marininema mesophilum]